VIPPTSCTPCLTGCAATSAQCAEFCIDPEKGMRRWWCGSEDDQPEDLKPSYGGNDHREPRVDQNRVLRFHRRS
jgi:hypothetical protein